MDVITELRKFRILKVAVVDVVGSILVCESIGRRLGYPEYAGALSAIPIGILIHVALGIPTQLNRYLGLVD